MALRWSLFTNFFFLKGWTSFCLKGRVHHMTITLLPNPSDKCRLDAYGHSVKCLVWKVTLPFTTITSEKNIKNVCADANYDPIFVAQFMLDNFKHEKNWKFFRVELKYGSLCNTFEAVKNKTSANKLVWIKDSPLYFCAAAQRHQIF